MDNIFREPLANDLIKINDYLPISHSFLHSSFLSVSVVVFVHALVMYDD